VSRGQVVNAATVTAPADVFDPDTSNNSSIDVNRIFNDPRVCRTSFTRDGPVSPVQVTGEPGPACRSPMTGRAAERGSARD
jgi:hypothetical protein